uniref:Wound-responsive family protein n=1 Tax=Oryza meridionalis TaxID=40149 RepID=A0A0E0E5G0_9ORYZ
MSSSSLSKKASSFVVTASMSAVEALKDQAGLCRWDYALRSLYQRTAAAKQVTGRAVPLSLSSSSQIAGSGGAAAASFSPAAACGRAARSKRSEEEKMQKAYHLVCWGPN